MYVMYVAIPTSCLLAICRQIPTDTGQTSTLDGFITVEWW